MDADARVGAVGEESQAHNVADGAEKGANSAGKELAVDKVQLEKGQGWTGISLANNENGSGESSASEKGQESMDVPRNGFFSPHDDHYPESTNALEVQKAPSPPEKDHHHHHHGQHTSVSQSPAHSIKSGSAMRDALRQNRDRSGSSLRDTTNGTPRSSILSSMVFVTTALEHIAASKEARRNKGLHESVQAALSAAKSDASTSPEIIFEPLRLATETASIPLTTTALDCIGKLIAYSYFSISVTPPENPTKEPQIPLIERAIDTICDCFQDEATPAEVQLQIVKSLLAAVLNDKIIVHGAGLLKAVRQIFNIFLLSKSSANQQVAQGTLTQMVGTVFERVKIRLSMKETRLNMSKVTSERETANGSQVDLNGENIMSDIVENDGSSEGVSAIPPDRPVHKEPGEKLTLKSFENAKNFDDTRIQDNAPTMVTRVKANSRRSRTASGGQASLNGIDGHADHDLSDQEEEDEIYVKDAFLVFRSMCRLGAKPASSEQSQDLKSPSMRSKLVSLAIIRTLLNNNMDVFTSPLVTIRSSVNNEPASFGQATNQYLRLALSKNGASSVRQVFETGCEIFWLMLKHMRVMLKVRMLHPPCRFR